MQTKIEVKTKKALLKIHESIHSERKEESLLEKVS